MEFTKQEIEELVDKIASYLEQDTVWCKLKRDTWIICGRSDELRSLLRESLAGLEKHLLTPSDVRKMTPDQVKENYELILESMESWS
jgi:predicted KAP-like P-loop ATPase